jgi:hypothetical protein
VKAPNTNGGGGGDVSRMRKVGRDYSGCHDPPFDPESRGIAVVIPREMAMKGVRMTVMIEPSV